MGYALSGGGARGYAHLGVLIALDAYGVKPQIIAGTSVGSLAGVLYADGYSPEEILEISANINFKKLVEITKPTSGFFKTSGITTSFVNIYGRNLSKNLRFLLLLLQPICIILLHIHFQKAKI